MLDNDDTADRTTESSTDSATDALTGPGADQQADTAQAPDEAIGAPAKKTAKKAAKKAAKKPATAARTATKKTAAKRTATKAVATAEDDPAEDRMTGAEADAPGTKPAAKKAAAKKTAKAAAKKAAATEAADDATTGSPDSDEAVAAPATAKKAATTKATAKKSTAKKSTAKKAAAKKTAAQGSSATADPATSIADTDRPDELDADPGGPGEEAADGTGAAVVFQPPTTRTRTRRSAAASAAPTSDDQDAASADDEDSTSPDTDDEAPASSRQRSGRPAAPSSDSGDSDQDTGDDADGTEASDDSGGEGEGQPRRRRRRGGRRRRKSGGAGDATGDTGDAGDSDAAGEQSGTTSDEPAKASAPGRDGGGGEGRDGDGEGSGSRRRRRRRRAGEEADSSADDPEKTVTRVRKQRSAEDEITSLSGSTRLEAKKQRRREGREAGRRRAPIVSEAEFLARRESVDRTMVIRQREDLTQIAVLEDSVLVEHYVARESQTSLIGNVYLGRVQNVLPSMEAAFVDIGKGRNAVIYAGEVNWTALGAKDGPRKIEAVLKSGQQILVQVSKDPVGHKGARLTGQISLPGRFLVYVPDGTTSGISRKLPDTERSRLKSLLKGIVPESAGVIVRTAAEGASEEELTRDVERLKARWEDIEKKAAGGGGSGGPQLLYGEPDLTLKVVRDLFTEDFRELVVSGDTAWDTVHSYVEHVAPDLVERVTRYAGDAEGRDVFADLRIDEQIAKGLDRKVWLPSGGSLVIDRTEAMTVVDVNTGKFTGSGGNLEETVTKNNLEAAEEIVRQLRLRDIGGIIVVDFIDMVLESNRDLVLRRLVECLGRDRTRHQVAEVTSLGLVQMTRKRIGTGLLEAFSETCPHCQGRGLTLHDMPVDPASKKSDDEPRRGRGRGRGGDGGGRSSDSGGPSTDGGTKGAEGGGRSGGGRGGSRRTSDAPATAPAPTPGAVPSPKDVAAMARADAARSEPTSDDPPAAGTGEQPVEAAATDARAPRTPAKVAGDPLAGSGDAADAAPSDAPPSDDPGVPAPDGPTPDPVAPAPADPAPAEPRVVTRTRTRSARRPAGPPAGAADPTPAAAPASSTPSGAGADDPGASPADGATAGAEAGPAPDHAEAEHVPVKRKGGRKR